MAHTKKLHRRANFVCSAAKWRSRLARQEPRRCVCVLHEHRQIAEIKLGCPAAAACKPVVPTKQKPTITIKVTIATTAHESRGRMQTRCGALLVLIDHDSMPRVLFQKWHTEGAEQSMHGGNPEGSGLFQKRQGVYVQVLLIELLLSEVRVKCTWVFKFSTGPGVQRKMRSQNVAKYDTKYSTLTFRNQ